MPKKQPKPGVELTAEQAVHLSFRAGSAFHPAAPIDSRGLFAGRVSQIERAADAVHQRGQHAIIYGERGVGKTSLANIIVRLFEEVGEGSFPAKVNCDGKDTFASAWLKVLRNVTVTHDRAGMGFAPRRIEDRTTLADSLPSDPSPDDLRLILESVPRSLVIVFDEFDRLPPDAARVFTDLIKTLSDYSVKATVILVGVADTVEELVYDHGSIDRALVQILMPRMREDELEQILIKAADELGIGFDSTSRLRIVRLSQGLPHYTHLVGLYAVRAALNRRRLLVTPADVDQGLGKAVENAQHSIKMQYHQATQTARKDALFEQALLACALAKTDPLSFFQAADVVKPMSMIMQRRYEITAFARHLNEFCSASRGPVLEKTGQKRRYRYRFKNPLLQPFVIMNGLSSGLISPTMLQAGKPG